MQLSGYNAGPLSVIGKHRKVRVGESIPVVKTKNFASTVEDPF